MIRGVKKKILTFGLTAALAASLLAGCGSAPESAEPEKVTEAEPADTAADEQPAVVETADENTETETVEEEAEPAYTVPEVLIIKKYYYETADDEEYTPLLKGHFEMPVLSDESAAMYPALAETMQKDADDELAYFDDEAEYLVSSAKEWLEDADSYFFGPLSVTQDVEVTRADEKVLSFYYPVYEYAGGAHGIYGNGFANYDVQSGSILKLSDVLTSTDGLQQLIRERLEEKYADSLDMFNDLDSDLATYVDMDDEENAEAAGLTGDDAADEEADETGDDYDYKTAYKWVMTNDHLEFYFGPYELAPYAAGDQYVEIYYSDHPDLFNKDYLPDEETGSFIKPFDHYFEGYDLNGDGEADPVSLDIEYNDDYTEPVGLSLSVGDKTEELSEQYSLAPEYDDACGYCIHTDAGKDYLYIESIEYNDYYRLMIFDITGGDIKFVNEDYYKYPVATYDDDNGLMRRYIMYDPAHFKLAKNFDLIATFVAFKNYHIGDDGIPVSDETIYTIGSTADYEPITCVQDFECDFVDEKGNVTSTETVASGETFKLLKTDGESYVDAMISDGRIVRLKVSGSASDVVVNGIRGDELFKALMYAG